MLDGHEPNCFLVIVDCHLRKFSRPEFEALGVDADYYCERLVHAVVQRCYQTLLDRGSNIMINGAGMREDVGIRLCLTRNAELPTTLTVTPTLAETFDSAPRSLEPIWNEPISAKDMEVLNKSRDFRQAYYPEEFPWQDVRSFPPFAFMMMALRRHTTPAWTLCPSDRRTTKEQTMETREIMRQLLSKGTIKQLDSLRGISSRQWKTGTISWALALDAVCAFTG